MRYKSCSIQSLFDCLLLQWRRQNSYTIKSLLYWYNLHVSLLFQNHHKLLWNTYFRAGWTIETVEWIIPYFGVCMKRKYPKTLQFCLLYSKVYFHLFLTFSICSLIFFLLRWFCATEIINRAVSWTLSFLWALFVQNCTCMNSAIVFNLTTFTGVCSLQTWPPETNYNVNGKCFSWIHCKFELGLQWY